jgi:hypothetical protein
MLLCMRTTLEIGDELFRRAKRRAVNEGATFREVVETALALYLSKGSRKAAPYRLRWRTESGRVLPGVRLDDRDALFDLMEDRR